MNARLEELRQALRDENMSYGELAELQGLADQIKEGDVELLEAAGVPEFPSDEQDNDYAMQAKTNRVRFTVEFDSEVWPTLTPEQRSRWIGQVNDAINEHAYVSDVETNA